MKSKSIIYILLVLSGVVIGSLVGKLTAGIDFLNWLSYGIRFGTKTPFSLELGVISFDFGLSIDLTVSCIIFILLALIIGRKVF